MGPQSIDRTGENKSMADDEEGQEVNEERKVDTERRYNTGCLWWMYSVRRNGEEGEAEVVSRRKDAEVKKQFQEEGRYV